MNYLKYIILAIITALKIHYLYIGSQMVEITVILFFILGALATTKKEFTYIPFIFIILCFAETYPPKFNTLFYYKLTDFTMINILPFIIGAWLRLIFQKHSLILSLSIVWISAISVATLLLLPFRDMLSDYFYFRYISTSISFLLSGIFIKKYITKFLSQYFLFFIPYAITSILSILTTKYPLEFFLIVSIGMIFSTIGFFITTPKF